MNAHLPVRWLPTGGAVLLFAGVALWSVSMLGMIVGYLPPPPFFFELMVGVPVALGLARLLTEKPTAPLGLLAAWTGIVAVAIIGSFVVKVTPLAAFAVPAVAIAVLVTARHPRLTFVALFALTGTFGSLTAFASLPVGPMADAALLGLFAAAVFALVTGKADSRVHIWPGVALIAAYIGITGFSSLAADRPDLGLMSFRASTWYMLAALVVGYAVWRAGSTEVLVKGVIAVAVLVGGYAMLRWQIGPSPSEWALATSSASVYNYVDGKLRLFGSFSSGHELAAWCSAVIPACCAYALTLRSRWTLFAAAGAAMCAFAVFASEVRIGILAVGAGLAVVFVLYQFARGFEGLHLGTTSALLVGGAIVAVLAFGATVGGDSVRTQRIANILTPERDPAYQARVVKWESAMADLRGKPFGHGIGTAGRVQQRNQRFVTIASVNVDNGYLKMAWEQGYAIAALFLVGALVLLGGLARRAVLTGDRLRAGAGIAAAGALTSYLVLLFAGVYNEGLTALAAWLIVGIGIAQFARPPARDDPQLA